MLLATNWDGGSSLTFKGNCIGFPTNMHVDCKDKFISGFIALVTD